MLWLVGRQQQDYAGVAEALLRAIDSLIPVPVLTLTLPALFSFWRSGPWQCNGTNRMPGLT